MGSQLRRAGATAAAIVLSAALVACGSDQPNASGSPARESTSTPAESTPTPAGLTGDWKADPGQADRVQQKLTATGFQCSKSSDAQLDLRLCSATKQRKDEYGSALVAQGILRYASDAQGTVVLANVWAGGPYEDKAAYEKLLAGAVLPATDAAVFAADGETLEWGKVVDNGDSGKYLAVKGWTPAKPLISSALPLKISKEKALAPLQAAKLQCKFSDRDKWGTARKALECTDPAFKVKEEDGSIAGATADLVAVDEGEGISTIVLEGAHAKVPAENARGAKLLIPRAVAIDPSLQEAADWLTKNLDVLPRAAYVGQWLVTTTVVREGGITSWPMVQATITTERLNLGLQTRGTEWESLQTETPDDSATETTSPSETPSN
ncbi:hypothetical protein EV646_115136 [Kribbella antiqua]|uniref:Uncharacterized protein n=1 Tax=Kribbella antiqua TaxID=2512217 RepID=A0A4R2IFV4_9ACTN|nr:hypothetical protein [Kribbella antiqua]TCO41595.1 hypothetical protein EV646_115136 [Kribbella antiqua]